MSKIFKPKIVMPPVPPAPEPVRYEPPAITPDSETAKDIACLLYTSDAADEE